jgi:hypothetical protein
MRGETMTTSTQPIHVAPGLYRKDCIMTNIIHDKTVIIGLSMTCALGLSLHARAASAHATFNVGGFGDISTGASNSTIGGEGATKIYLGGTTGGGLAGSLHHSGSTNGNEVWTNESPATEWVGPTGPNHAGSSAGSVLPSAAYVGMHTPTQNRLLETGIYGSSATTCTTNGDCVGVNTNGNSLLRQVYNQNHAPAFYTGGPSNTTPLPTDLSLAVAPHSWNDGEYNSGMDVLNPHVSGYQYGFPNDFTLHPNLEQNLLDQAPGTPLYLNMSIFDDPSDGLGPQQMGVALYGGWDDGNGLSDLTFLGKALAPVGGNAELTYALNSTYFGEYTVLIGDNSAVGGQYKAHFTISSTPLTTPVPLPAAVWLFGSGAIGLAALARHRAASVSA